MKLRDLLLTLPVCCALTVPMHADTIFSENFNEVATGETLTQAGAFSTLNGTNIDVFNVGYCEGPESGNCVDLGGTDGRSLGQLATTIDLGPGTYELSFDLIGSQRGQVTSTTVNFGSYSQTFILGSSDDLTGVVNQLVTVTGGPTQLEFIENGVGGNNNIGAVLDNVSISTTASPVPEPGTLALLATGLFGAAGAMRRRIQV